MFSFVNLRHYDNVNAKDIWNHNNDILTAGIFTPWRYKNGNNNNTNNSKRSGVAEVAALRCTIWIFVSSVGYLPLTHSFSDIFENISVLYYRITVV